MRCSLRNTINKNLRISIPKITPNYFCFQRYYTIKWKASAKKHELQWENTNDLDIQKKYRIASIPAIYLISPTGIIVYNNLQSNDTDLLEKLSALLQKSM